MLDELSFYKWQIALEHDPETARLEFDPIWADYDLGFIDGFAKCVKSIARKLPVIGGVNIEELIKEV